MRNYYYISWLVIALLVSSRAQALPGQDPSSVISADSIRVHHEALVGIATAAGGFEAGIRLNGAGTTAAEYLQDGYREAGLENVRFEAFRPNRWWPEEHSLSLLDARGAADSSFVTFPVWYSEGADDLDLEIVYAGYGSVGELYNLDVKGKAVLIDMKRLLHFVPSWHPQLTDSMRLLRDKGARAIITAETRINQPTGASVGNPGTIVDQVAEPAELFPLPVLAIGKEDGRRLKQRIYDGGARVRINLRYSLEQTEAVNVVGELRGNGKTDEYIVIGGHYDTWFGGAVDNLGSQASLLEMARYFSRIPQEERDRHIIFVSLFGHELENHAMGQAAFVERRADILGKITCFLNVDGSGSWGWEEMDDSGEVIPTNREDKGGIFATSFALSALAHEAIYRHYGSDAATWMQFPLNFFVSDQYDSIAKTGMPSVLLISKNIFYHSVEDTLERISPEQVQRRTLINIDVARAILESPAGYYMSLDTNPHVAEEPREESRLDLTLAQLPTNPTPWQTDPPRDLSMHLIPQNVQVFSPVIAWVGYWTSDAITDYESIAWDFGGVVGLMGRKHGFFSGTMYLLPGEKTITMSITDSQGRERTVERQKAFEPMRLPGPIGYLSLP
jgi:hypothetical protein